jgi:hypothetical protein
MALLCVMVTGPTNHAKVFLGRLKKGWNKILFNLKESSQMGWNLKKTIFSSDFVFL